jgi:hypothetical protein
MDHDHGRKLADHFAEHPEDYEASLPGPAQSGTHGAVVALAKQLVVRGEATDLADGIGKVLAESPHLYGAMLRDAG